MKGQAIERGYLGIRIQAVNEDLAASLGIAHNRGEFVQAVEPGGAADKAGLQSGDVVMKVNGQNVTPDQTLSYIVANVAPGTRIPIELIRDGKPRTVTATVGKRPTEEELARQQMFDPENTPPEDGRGSDSGGSGVLEQSLGVQVIPLTPQIARQLGIADGTQGVVVAGVDPSSDAGAKGLQRGDLILNANYKVITSPADLQQAVNAAKAAKREALLVQVQRRGGPAQYVPIRLR